MASKIHDFVPAVMKPVGGTITGALALEGDDGYIMERKLDGFRLTTMVEPSFGGAAGFSRARKDIALGQRAPAIHRELMGAGFTGLTVLDGELSTDDDDFMHVHRCMKSLAKRCRELQAADKPLVYVVFDVLFLNGVDVRGLPWKERRALLEEHVSGEGFDLVKLSPVFPVNADLIGQWQAAGGEGAIIKNVESRYFSGKRPRGVWQKVKAVQDIDVVVMGFTPGRGKYLGYVGALRFGLYKDGVLTEVGQCSGMTDNVRFGMTADPKAYVGRVAVVQHYGYMSDGFRHPQWKGLRDLDDKAPEDCTFEDQVTLQTAATS